MVMDPFSIGLRGPIQEQTEYKSQLRQSRSLPFLHSSSNGNTRNWLLPVSDKLGLGNQSSGYGSGHFFSELGLVCFRYPSAKDSSSIIWFKDV